eukprot:3124561-Alexandrium_andersonii.AAC.1
MARRAPFVTVSAGDVAASLLPGQFDPPVPSALTQLPLPTVLGGRARLEEATPPRRPEELASPV